MSKQKRSIKNVLINPRYQLRYIFWMTSTGLLLILLYSSLFYSYMRENYKILVELSPMDDASKAQLYRELSQLLLFTGAFSIAFLVIVALVGLAFSHRTAGPLYHFQKVFREILAGKVSARIRLRPKDDFRDVAQTFNEMMDALAASKSGPRQGP